MKPNFSTPALCIRCLATSTDGSRPPCECDTTEIPGNEFAAALLSIDMVQQSSTIKASAFALASLFYGVAGLLEELSREQITNLVEALDIDDLRNVQKAGRDAFKRQWERLSETE
jgi:hypothetical protein